jgi:hypothetical protein
MRASQEHQHHFVDPLQLDISLGLIQLVGPQAFLVGQPTGARIAPFPAFL